MSGEKTQIWKNEWHEAGILESLYPDILNLMEQEDGTIAEMRMQKGWNWNFRRQMND